MSHPGSSERLPKIPARRMSVHLSRNLLILIKIIEKRLLMTPIEEGDELYLGNISDDVVCEVLEALSKGEEMARFSVRTLCQAVLTELRVAVDALEKESLLTDYQISCGEFMEERMLRDEMMRVPSKLRCWDLLYKHCVFLIKKGFVKAETLTSILPPLVLEPGAADEKIENCKKMFRNIFKNITVEGHVYRGGEGETEGAQVPPSPPVTHKPNTSDEQETQVKKQTYLRRGSTNERLKEYIVTNYHPPHVKHDHKSPPEATAEQGEAGTTSPFSSYPHELPAFAKNMKVRVEVNLPPPPVVEVKAPPPVPKGRRSSIEMHILLLYLKLVERMAAESVEKGEKQLYQEGQGDVDQQTLATIMEKVLHKKNDVEVSMADACQAVAVKVQKEVERLPDGILIPHHVITNRKQYGNESLIRHELVHVINRVRLWDMIVQHFDHLIRHSCIEDYQEFARRFSKLLLPPNSSNNMFHNCQRLLKTVLKNLKAATTNVNFNKSATCIGVEVDYPTKSDESDEDESVSMEQALAPGTSGGLTLEQAAVMSRQQAGEVIRSDDQVRRQIELAKEREGLNKEMPLCSVYTGPYKGGGGKRGGGKGGKMGTGGNYRQGSADKNTKDKPGTSKE